MLKWIGDFHDENNKANPDQAKLRELREGIQWVINDELRVIKQLQAGAQEALTGLEGFHGQCEKHEAAMRANANSLEAQLVREGNDIESMQKKIDAAQAEVDEYQARIDGSKKFSTVHFTWNLSLTFTFLCYRKQSDNRCSQIYVGVS